MKIYAMVPVVLSAVSVTIAVYEFLIWLRTRRGFHDLAFMATCLAAACYQAACAGQYNSSDAAASLAWMRVESVSLNLGAFSFLWYVSTATKGVSKSLLTFFAIWFGASAAANFLPGDFAWIAGRTTELRIGLPFGLSVEYVGADFGPITKIQFVSGVAVTGYILVVLWRSPRSGARASHRPLYAVR
jgi:hypothetical protein